MADFGGLGGIPKNVPFDKWNDDLFAQALNRALGDQMRCPIYGEIVCAQVWSALANMDWRHENGDTAGYSFRAAGDLIASIKGEGIYMDWYCSGPYAMVAGYIEDAMAKEGWRPEEDAENI